MLAIDGRYNGHQLRPHQCSNDWITADVTHCPFDSDGDGNCRICASPAIVINPLHVKLDNADEGRWFQAHATGSFRALYVLGEDRRFYLREELPR